MSIRVSVIIPVYNTSKYLPGCLDSILCQDYDNLEVIAVNDGSTDDSLSILEKYKGKYNNLIVISKPNGGLQSARNKGAEYVTGDFLTFVDSDDTLPDERVISEMVSKITDNTQLVVGRMNIVVDGKRTLFGASVFDTLSTKTFLSDYILCGKFGWNVCGKLLKADTFRRMGNMPVNVTAAEDALFTISFLNIAEGEVNLANVPVYDYLMRSDSITHSKNVKYIYDNLVVGECVQKMLEEKIPDKNIMAFRVLGLLNSFRYGWMGVKHPLVKDLLIRYKNTKGVLPLLSYKKRLFVWMLVNMGDFLSLLLNNRINEEK